jgi:hypothetical protein
VAISLLLCQTRGHNLIFRNTYRPNEPAEPRMRTGLAGARRIGFFMPFPEALRCEAGGVLLGAILT